MPPLLRKRNVVDVSIKMRLESLANTHGHWRKIAGIKKKHSKAVHAALYGKRAPEMPLVVTLTRVGKRMLDGDNLQGAFKAVRDAVALWVGEDDGSPLYDWRYEQVVGSEYEVRIRVEPSR